MVSDCPINMTTLPNVYFDEKKKKTIEMKRRANSEIAPKIQLFSFLVYKS